MLIDEAHDLLNTWKQIIDFQKTSKPTCLYEESDLMKRCLMTAVDKKHDRILIDDHNIATTLKKMYQKYSGEHPLKIEYYRDTTPMFERFNVEREIDKSLRRKIWLSSGGYLFFDRTRGNVYNRRQLWTKLRTRSRRFRGVAGPNQFRSGCGNR